ncbi:hypothetical protein DUI87_02311 [Hirundo rustica rustica]|uniref:CCHC-type domain-containing protein n=1 Tax=Hirundo rustica rustica TaxID=333673 RepID=A0A3M0L7X0_HIRRU|nr:hypothetical protein DUI87_02311 [Hirundo rustica rustica]
MSSNLPNHHIHPDDIITWRVVYSALQQFKDSDNLLADALSSSPSDTVVFANETSPEENDLEKKDMFDLGPIDSGQEPDLYPSLAPVHAMAAAVPSTKEILQTACKKAAANISHIPPPSYASSYSSSDYDEERMPSIGPDPERQKIHMQEAADAVLKSLAYENANSDYKKALDLIRNHADVELSDYIKACADISSEQLKAELTATVIAQQLQMARAAIKCFKCRELGHIRKQYPKGQRGNKKPSKPCPPCQRGFIGAINAGRNMTNMATFSHSRETQRKFWSPVLASPTGPHSIRHQYKPKPCKGYPWECRPGPGHQGYHNPE